ncbi:hypothetical protein BCR39DRAFT_587775 [Naematelia encephala]|uniref:RNA polymerase I-specific transcription initiation factor RRN6-like protein n=1 Tax=Naematelia encephala TaxID=71784 RepID=A0A1Y2B7K2_9TREE|nr:hypothetical protein BCR39DRAFT_587775 [Naematelia encephala]
MAFPASVSKVTLTKPRQGQPLPRRRLLPGEDELPDPHEPSAEVGIGGPSLDFGRDGGVRLDKYRGRWGWTWLAGNDERIKLESGKEMTMIFPPTRIPDVEVPAMPLNTMMKSAEDYLMSFSEIDHPSLLMDQVQPELSLIQQESKRPRQDPYLSNRLAVLRNERASSAKSALIFPSGELGHHLNVSPFLSSTEERPGGNNTRFTPTMKPLERFGTEILQICSLDTVSSHRIDRDSTPLLVRLHSTTHYFNLIPDHTYVPPIDAAPFTTLRVGSLTSAETGGRRHVDAALDPLQWGRGVVVDECGGVWLIWEEKIEKHELQEKVFKYKELKSPITDKRDQFFRISFGTRPGTVLVVSSRMALIVDIEAPDYPVTKLIELTGQSRFFTSLDPTALLRGATYTCLCTTYEVMWIDECATGIPAASWRHDFGSGKVKDLAVRTLQTETGEVTLLYSHSDPFVMVFHVTSSPPIRSLHPPYPLPLSIPRGGLNAMTTMTIRRKHRRPTTILVGLSRDGSIWSCPLIAGTVDNPEASKYRARLKVRIDDELDPFFAQKTRAQTLESERAVTKYRELDMRWAWIEINRDTAESDETFDADGFERYLREIDAPFEHLMTASDLARDLIDAVPLGEEDQARSIRGQLLKPLPLGPSTSEDLSRLDNIAFDRYFNVVSLDTGAGGCRIPSLDELEKAFRDGSYRTRCDIRRLAFDLALSNVVLSSDLILPPPAVAEPRMLDIGSPEDLMARITLNEREAAPVTFGFLTPHITESESLSDNEPEAGPSRIPNANARPDRPETAFESPSVRSLLSEWQVNESPESYIWKPWRDTLSTPDRSDRPIRPLPSSPRQSQIPSFLTQSSFPSKPHMQPSALRAALSVPSLVPPVPMAFSSPPRAVGAMQSQESLDQEGGGAEDWPSTQIERGKFGGKLPEKGKKKVKKRVGGF